MTDQDRAWAFSARLTEGVAEPLATDDINALAEQFAAVRLEERARVVAFLRRRASENAGTTGREQRDVWSVYVASVRGEADRIERGEHSREQPRG